MRKTSHRGETEVATKKFPRPRGGTTVCWQGYGYTLTLQNANDILREMKLILHDAGVTVEKTEVHEEGGKGISIVIWLLESHIIIVLWPEEQWRYVDFSVSLCNYSRDNTLKAFFIAFRAFRLFAPKFATFSFYFDGPDEGVLALMQKHPHLYNVLNAVQSTASFAAFLYRKVVLGRWLPP